jgi:hypothetical protein
MAPLHRRTQQGQAAYDALLAKFRGRLTQPSAAQNMYPTHPSSSMHYLSKAANPGTAARLYPNLPSSAAARMQKPKPKPRASLARRIYGSLE